MVVPTNSNNYVMQWKYKIWLSNSTTTTYRKLHMQHTNTETTQYSTNRKHEIQHIQHTLHISINCIILIVTCYSNLLTVYIHHEVYGLMFKLSYLMNTNNN
jgi:hypothetical protein